MTAEYEQGYEVRYQERGQRAAIKGGAFSPPLWGVHCAWCGHEYTHICEPSVHPHDDYDPTNPTGFRNTWVDISFVCENCDGYTALVIAHHKGMTAVGVFRKTLKPQFPELRGSI